MKGPPIDNGMDLYFGLLAPAISHQLEGQLEKEQLQRFDMDADAITRLHVRGMLTEREAKTARHRLAKEIDRLLALKDN